jgi:hypothetical protein
VAARGFVDPDRARRAIEPKVRVGLVEPKFDVGDGVSTGRIASSSCRSAPTQPRSGEFM